MPRRLLLAVCAFAVMPSLVACGGDGDDSDGGDPGTTATTSAANPTNSPTLARPAGKYSISIDDLGQNFRTDISQTFAFDASTYANEGRVRAFPSAGEATKKLNDWGYIEGYQTGYIPEDLAGPEGAVLKGGFYVTVETHLFKDAKGAMEAYEYFADYLGSTAQVVEAPAIGNRSAAYVTTIGKIGKTQVAATYHHLIFVRGNVLTIVLTKGAQGFMKVDTVVALARISDEKLLGERAATEPTPTSNSTTPTAAAR